MTRFTALALATFAFAPTVSFAAEAQRCTPAVEAGARLSNSGLSCSQWAGQFAPGQSQTAHNDRAAAPRS